MSSDKFPQGGRLEDMAATGTTIPDDASKPNYIKSVPRPDQIPENQSSQFTSSGIGSGSLATASDQATDIPRRNMDTAMTGEVITGTGDQLPAEVESKNLHIGADSAYDKGHDRRAKHRAENKSKEERLQGEGAEMDEAPGEEDEEQDVIRARKGGQGL